MQTTLSMTVAGVRYPNPFVLASAPPTASREMIERAFDAGWGGAVIKTLAQEEPDGLRDVSPRIQGVRSRGRLMGFTNIELGTRKTVDDWLEAIAAIKRKYPDRVLIASLLYGGAPIEKQWREVPALCAQAGADALELNFSCPHGGAELGGLAEIGTHPDLMAEVLGWVRASTSLPVYVKLPPVSDVVAGALTCRNGGADGISAINTVSSFPGVDVETFRPLLNVNGCSAFGGLSGRMIKPLALRCVAQIARTTDLPVSGIGGIYEWRDAVEFMLLGASTVQVCSAVMENGYGIIADLCSGLAGYLERKGMASPAELVGRSLPFFAAHGSLDRGVKVVAEVERVSCRRCGKCVVSCRDGGYQAIAADAEGFPVVDTARCDGCGLCAQICPFESMALRRV